MLLISNEAETSFPLNSQTRGMLYSKIYRKLKTLTYGYVQLP
jgi:hypothetical protein